MSTRTRSALIGGILLTAALPVGASLAQRGTRGTPGFGGGYGYGMGAGMMGYGSGYGSQTLDYNAARAMIQNSLQDATIDPSTNTVTYKGTRITLDVIAVQPDKPDTTFEIASLVNPTIKLPRGATITLNLVNMDYGRDMPHGLVITRQAPPYAYMTMSMMGAGTAGGIPPLSARSANDLQTASYAADSTQFRTTTPGTYYYLCQVPGHAQKGMHGKIIVQ